MDSTDDRKVPSDRVEDLLASVVEADPAEAVGPLSEIADLLEALLDDEMDH